MKLEKCEKGQAGFYSLAWSDRRETQPRYAAVRVPTFWRKDSNGVYEGHDRGDGVIVVPHGNGYSDYLLPISRWHSDKRVARMQQ